MLSLTLVSVVGYMGLSPGWPSDVATPGGAHRNKDLWFLWVDSATGQAHAEDGWAWDTANCPLGYGLCNYLDTDPRVGGTSDIITCGGSNTGGMVRPACFRPLLIATLIPCCRRAWPCCLPAVQS